MFSTARRGMMLNLFFTASAMPEHWFLGVESVHYCSFLQILLKKREEEKRSSISFDIYKLRDSTLSWSWNCSCCLNVLLIILECFGVFFPFISVSLLIDEIACSGWYSVHKTLSSSHLFLHVLFNVPYPILYSQKSRRSFPNALSVIREIIMASIMNNGSMA